jgi:hypothetical protein
MIEILPMGTNPISMGTPGGSIQYIHTPNHSDTYLEELLFLLFNNSRFCRIEKNAANMYYVDFDCNTFTLCY